MSLGPAGPPNQVFLSLIELKASDGGLYVLFTNLLGKHSALFKTFFFLLKPSMRISVLF